VNSWLTAPRAIFCPRRYVCLKFNPFVSDTSAAACEREFGPGPPRFATISGDCRRTDLSYDILEADQADGISTGLVLTTTTVEVIVMANAILHRELQGAIENARNWYASIQEMLAAGDRQAIEESVLSVLVRDGWHAPGGMGEAEEFEVLLSTAGQPCGSGAGWTALG
jgi:hypothetical protein